MAEPLAEFIARALGAAVTRTRRVAGGDICDAWRVDLDDGRVVFAKEHGGGSAMFEAEARGLRWLAEAGALRTPAVLAVSPRALVLEYIEPGGRTARFDEAFGRGLAALHACTPASFGWDVPGVIASLPQDNTPEEDWATFLGQRRLAPLLERCVAHQRLPPEAAGELDALLRVLPDRLGPAEPPARLHGDLWSGNAMADHSGEPVIYDPAPYGGHREIDLAMMRLFGGFSPRTFAAYEEVTPLLPEHEDRIELMQLYPVLVHVALFGGHYASRARRTMRRYA
ncbi:MAG: fructosamine kinase family protein [Nannocystaceae bacterium]|nr:fructosamine kinase family protein [bacterium]